MFFFYSSVFVPPGVTNVYGLKLCVFPSDVFSTNSIVYSWPSVKFPNVTLEDLLIVWVLPPLIETETEDFENWFENQSQNFDKWFQEIKNQLSTDAAGNLQLQLDDVKQMLIEAISPVTTEDGDYLATESGEMLIQGMK